MCRACLKLNLDKTYQILDYSTEKLPKSVIEHSALDSIISRKIGEMLVKINDSKIKCSVNHDCFKEGEDVTIAVGGNIVATASV